MLNSVLRQSRSPYEAADTAETTIERALPAALREFQKNNPDQFERRSPGGLQILVVELNGAGEVQVARRFIPYDSTHAVQRENAAGSDERVGVALIGETSAIDRELDRLHGTNAWAGKNDATNLGNMARRFIALEIVDKPKQVGPPVSMVSIDPDGTHWVERGACGP
jgi:hypothetical protein